MLSTPSQISLAGLVSTCHLLLIGTSFTSFSPSLISYPRSPSTSPIKDMTPALHHGHPLGKPNQGSRFPSTRTKFLRQRWHMECRGCSGNKDWVPQVSGDPENKPWALTNLSELVLYLSIHFSVCVSVSIFLHISLCLSSCISLYLCL